MRESRPETPANAVGPREPASRPEQIPAPAWERMLARIEADAYAFQGGAAGNRAHGLRFGFGADGLRVRPATGSQGDWVWDLRLERFGYEGSLVPVRGVAPVAEGNRLEYRRGGLREWYVNDAAGLEQGFTVRSRPERAAPAVATVAADQHRPLVLEMESSGLAPVEEIAGASILLVDSGETGVLRYSGLLAWDANGADLPAEMHARGQRIRIEVDDRDATYPLTIDPLVERAVLRASDAQAIDQFGYSVAIGGDTAIVGARNEDGGPGDPLSNAGAAYVFARDQGGTGNWGEVKKLVASDAQAGDEFGWSVAIGGDTAIVGARVEDGGPGDPQLSAGAAYVFARDQGGIGNWGEVKKLVASDAQVGDVFGFSVSVSGDTAIVGAISEDGGPGNPLVNAGAAYVFSAPWLYVLDGFGGLHTAGGAPSIVPAPPYFGFDIARDAELSGAGALVLDGFGGVHPGVGVPPPPYFGFDVAEDVELAAGGGGYVLDALGGIHAMGGAPPLPLPATPYFGFDIARDLELDAGGGYYVLDGLGGLHRGGGAPAIVPGPPYFGFDIAKDLELVAAPAAYVLDGFGFVHALGGAPVLSPATPYFGFDVALDLELGPVGYYVLDTFGGLHRGGGAVTISPPPPYFGFPAARDLEIR